MLFPSISIVFIIYMLISTSILTIFILYYDLIASKASLLSFLLFKKCSWSLLLSIFPHESGIRSSVPYQKTPKSPAAAAAKLLQSYPTLCDPMDCSPPGSQNLLLIFLLTSP